MKKPSWKTYALWIVGVEAVGALSGFLTRDGAEVYSEMIRQPPLSPPAIVFPIVWSILFLLMGVSAARIYAAPASPARTRGLRVLILRMIFTFRKTDSLAAWLQVPYFLWVTFAAYLNLGVWMLNR